MSSDHAATASDEKTPEDATRPGGHDVTVVVNGRTVELDHKEELTFDEVVEVSGLPTGPDITFTITYRRGHGNKPEGSMVEGGDPVRVNDGMVFSVSSTNRS
jgi:hypothetical protein